MLKSGIFSRQNYGVWTKAAAWWGITDRPERCFHACRMGLRWGTDGYADMPLGGENGMEVAVEWGDGTTAIVYDTK